MSCRHAAKMMPSMSGPNQAIHLAKAQVSPGNNQTKLATDFNATESTLSIMKVVHCYLDVVVS